MADCLLCKADAAATDEQTYRALHFMIGKYAKEPATCETHLRSQAFALKTLAYLTGHGDFAVAIETAVRAPVLRLVPPATQHKSDAGRHE